MSCSSPELNIRFVLCSTLTRRVSLVFFNRRSSLRDQTSRDCREHSVFHGRRGSLDYRRGEGRDEEDWSDSAHEGSFLFLSSTIYVLSFASTDVTSTHFLHQSACPRREPSRISGQQPTRPSVLAETGTRRFSPPSFSSPITFRETS